MAAVIEGTVPGQRIFDGKVLPYVIVPADAAHSSASDLVDFISANQAHVDSLMVSERMHCKHCCAPC